MALHRLADCQKAKWIPLENGRKVTATSAPGTYRYAFDKPGEDYIPTDVTTKYRRAQKSKPKDCIVVFATETEVDIELPDDLGEQIPRIEIRSDSSGLLLKLSQRISDSADCPGTIATKLALGHRSDFSTIGIVPNKRDIVEVALSQDLTFVWGPPGTGKTYRLSLIAERLVREDKRVLMISGANVAVDEATLRVGERLHDLPAGTVVRYGNPRNTKLDNQRLTARMLARKLNADLAQREAHLLALRADAIAQKLLEIEDELRQIRKAFKTAERNLAKEARFLATTCARASVDPTIHKQRFDVVIYDEVGMANVPEVVFAGTLAKERMCCFGDFRQLPPIVDDRVPELKRDIFDRLGIVDAVDEGEPHDLLVMLDEQWRCHPDIAAVASEEMYGGLLTTSPETTERTTRECTKYAPQLPAIGMVDLSRMPSLGLKDSSSHFNLLSASACVEIAMGMPKEWSVAIITPYKSQAQIVRGMLRDRIGDSERVRSATVHSFQGSEKEAVIFDVVDCEPRDSLGLLLSNRDGRAADRLINVAMTRAKSKFVIVANVEGLRNIYPENGLLLRKLFDRTIESHAYVEGIHALEIIALGDDGDGTHFFRSGGAGSAWAAFVTDIASAKKHILLVLARSLEGTVERLNSMYEAIECAASHGAEIEIYGTATKDLVPSIRRFAKDGRGLPNTAFAVIDNDILWNGLPCSWLKDHNGLRLAFDPMFRLSGGHAAKEVCRIYLPKIKRVTERQSGTRKVVPDGQLSFDFGC